MESDKSLKQLKRSTLLSTLSLFFQSGYSALLGFGANLILTILLSPTIFGIYITVLSIISLLNYFSDIGLAASLIQKKEISDDDIKTTFTVQQILIISVITIGFITTQFVREFYRLPEEGMYLYWSLLIAFFISSLKTIPSIFLERKIQFQKIVMVQVIENTVFYITVSLLAYLKFGLQSFTYAVLLRSITGVIIMYSISFWIPHIGISTKSLSHLLKFGLPFQGTSFLALFKDDLITLFLGKMLGFQNVGYIGWAKKWAEAPIRIIMDSVSRVLFPVFARIQEDKNKIRNLVDKILHYQTLLIAPSLVGLALVMNTMIHIIPKYSKWEPALPIFYMFCFAAFLSSYSTPFINVFNALGKVKISFSFMLFWTITTWISTPIFTKIYGIYGFPITQIILALTSAVVIIKARSLINFDIVQSVYKPLVSSLIMGVGVFFIQQLLGYTLLSIIASICIGGIIYLILINYVFRIDLIHELRSLSEK